MTSENLRIINGVLAVTTAGTRQKLVATGAASLTRVLAVTIRSHSTNGNLIYVGDDAVSSANGYRLSPGETISFDVGERRQYLDLSQIWLDAAVSGEGVTFTGLREF